MSSESAVPVPSLEEIRDEAPEAVSKLLDYEYSPIEPRNEDRPDIVVTKDITGKSKSTGDYSDFESLFLNRFEELSSILKKRSLKGHVEIAGMSRKPSRETITLVGLVTEVRQTRNGNRLIELQDKTGYSRVIVTDDRLMDEVDTLLSHEVVAFEGQLSDDKEIIFGNEIHYPDVPQSFRRTRTDRTVRAAFISDIHLAADTFAYEKWADFVNFVREEPSIEYVFVAGDLVEGIGVYPGQEDELDVKNIDAQYKLCGEVFKKFPDSVDIITCTGNHDAVRLAEPQPALPERFTKYFPDNVTFVGNPSTVKIENGITIELYHGMSINSFTDSVPSFEVESPEEIMKMMLKKRHLAPLFGHNTRIAPEKTDYLVLQEVPDVLHTGHVHTFGIDSYRNSIVANTGTWQYQTDFQEKMNIVPTVGRAPVMNLSNYDTTTYEF